MLRSILHIGILLFSSSVIMAATYYLDPVNGNLSNDGSADSPWSSLQAVIENNLIESYQYFPLPYDASNNTLEIKNESAPITSGDTLLLRDGLHGSITLRNYNNLDYITVKNDEGHDAAILENLNVQSGKYWRFEGLTISSEPYGSYLNGILVHFQSHGWHGPVSHIHISDCHVYSAELPWTTASEWLDNVSDGIFVRGDSMTIINNLVTNVDKGISALGDDISGINNTIRNFSGDGMRVLGSQILFDGNIISNCYDVDDNHDDGIQSFTTTGFVVDNNTLRNNIIINYEDPEQPLRGPLQGIGCFDGWYNNWVIENNLIIVDHWHGISLYGANNCKIINNTVLDPTPQVEPGMSWIRINNHDDGSPSMDCVVKNNISNQYVVQGDESNNSVLTTLEQYRDHFVDIDNIDYHLLPDSPLIDAGDDSVAPMMDRDGIIRPQGLASDIGCYEYQQALSQISTLLSQRPTVVLYPNPTSTILKIDTPDEVVSWTILNIWGNELHHGDQNTIDISMLSPGKYLLRVDGVTQIFVKY